MTLPQERDVFKIAMLQKLAMWNWINPSWTTYSSFFDEAVVLLSDKPKMIQELNKRFEDFRNKYGLDVASAEIKIYLRITGTSWKKLIKEQHNNPHTFNERPYFGGSRDREVNWLDMNKDLRLIKIWVQKQIGLLSSEIGMFDFEEQ
jgi:hypothetical protein